MSTEIQTPTGISGVLTVLSGVSFCMDDATHLIHSAVGATRLKARNNQVSDFFDKHSNGNTVITIMGFPAWGAECMFVSTYSAELLEDLKVSGGPIDSWPK